MAVTYGDQQIRQNVQSTISNDIRLNPSNISIGVANGVVTLNGSVPSYFQKTTAAEDARNIKGVIEVQNNLVVTLLQPFGNQEMGQTIRGNLDRDVRIVNPGNIGVTVNNGVVTLTGTVPSYNQKIDAGQDAWTTSGVVDVINQIAVVPPIPRTDAEIANDVRMALNTDAAIDPTNITVNVTGGTVYLNGTVPTYYQIQQAAQDAWLVPAVISVVNNLTVSF